MATVRLRRPAPRAGGAPRERRPGPARHRHLDVHRDVRARPVAACSARWPTARAAGRPRRSGCCPPARSRSSPARPRTGRGTRRRSARSSPTSSACRSRTSRSCTATPRSRRRAWTPTARGRWPSAASPSSRRREKVVDKAKQIAAHLLEASEDDLEFADGRFTVKGTDKGVAIQEVALAAFTAHDCPRASSPSLDARRHVRPGELLLPARHPPRARSRSTPRPGASTSASTSAWTTSATWSTR